MFIDKSTLPSAETALPGREKAIEVSGIHYIHQVTTLPPFPQGIQTAMFGMGCFWGAERKFWQLTGVYSTAVGYSAGFTKNPTYKEVCSGQTGHNEVVLVAFDPSIIGYKDLLKCFWEEHNPTQGMRQGHDRGTQYRSGIYTNSDEQQAQADASKTAFQQTLLAEGYPAITTEILPTSAFYYAEEYHQQYLAKNPNGYCGLGGTGACYNV